MLIFFALTHLLYRLLLQCQFTFQSHYNDIQICPSCAPPNLRPVNSVHKAFAFGYDQIHACIVSGWVQEFISSLLGLYFWFPVWEISLVLSISLELLFSWCSCGKARCIVFPFYDKLLQLHLHMGQEQGEQWEKTLQNIWAPTLLEPHLNWIVMGVPSP